MAIKIGLIGYGNMAQAIASGMIFSGNYDPNQIMVTDLFKRADIGGMRWGRHNIEVAEFSDVLVLAVKPGQYKEVIDEIKGHLKADVIIISIAAGLKIATLESYFDGSVKLMRTMPNTPAQLNLGMTALMPNEKMSHSDIKIAQAMFDAVGKTEIVSEDLIEAVIVTSGSSPAYIYMMIEAMIKGGMNEGMSREMATTFVTQAMIGATAMVMETGIAPTDLRDAVCSPGGTTIEAVKYLQNHDFEALVMEAMKACAARSRKMAEK